MADCIDDIDGKEDIGFIEGAEGNEGFTEGTEGKDGIASGDIEDVADVKDGIAGVDGSKDDGADDKDGIAGIGGTIEDAKASGDEAGETKPNAWALFDCSIDDIPLIVSGATTERASIPGGESIAILLNVGNIELNGGTIGGGLSHPPLFLNALIIGGVIKGTNNSRYNDRTHSNVGTLGKWKVLATQSSNPMDLAASLSYISVTKNISPLEASGNNIL